MHRLLLRRLLLLCLFTGSTLQQQALAQLPSTKKINLRIILSDSTQVPVSNAGVDVIDTNNSDHLTSVSDSAGTSTFSLSPGRYKLSISHISYSPYEQHLMLPSTDTTIRIVLSARSGQELEAVVLSGRKNPVRYLPGKTIIQVDGSINNTGTSALELLEQSPGVSVDKDGNISLKGRENVLVLMDGKQLYLSPTQLALQLAGMNSSDISHIELIDNPGAKYDAAGNAGIINITLKKNTRQGLNGNVSLTAGMGRYGKTTNTINLNYKNRRLNLYGNYGLNGNENFLNMIALRTYLDTDDKTILSQLEQPTFLRSSSASHTIRTGMDYTVNDKTTLGMGVSGNFSTRQGVGSGSGRWINSSNIIDSLISTGSTNTGESVNGMLNLNIRHDNRKGQSLAADIDIIGYRFQNLQLFENERLGQNNYKEAFKGDLPSNIRIFSLKADHTLNLPKNIRVESGLKWSGIETDNIADYFTAWGNTWLPDYSRTNSFTYAEQIKSAYSGISLTGQRWNMEGGLRYEHTVYDARQGGNLLQKDSSFSRSYGNFFPSLLIGYEADSIHEFSLSMGKRIDRPAYQKLNPFVYIINKYTYMSGNPLMHPQLTYNVKLEHIYKQTLNTSLSYSYSKDYFSQIFFSDSVGTIYYSEGNLGKRHTLGLSVGISHQLTGFWSLNVQTDLLHKQMKGFIWKEMEARITQMNININNQFRLGNGFTAELSGYYITRSQADIQEIVEPTGQIGLGLSRQVLKNKGSLKLSFRDIFYTQDMEGFTVFNQATEYFRFQRDTRLININFTYRFGKDFRASSPRTGGASEEIQRVTN